MIRSLILIFSLFICSFLTSSPVNAAVSNWQKGASIVPKNTTDFSSDTFKKSLSNLAGVNANYVTLVVPYYQSNLHSTDLGRGWNTPTDQSLIDAINYAHSLGLKVNIKMHIESYTGAWRAWIDPPDRTTWFKNYSSILNHYGDIGKQTGAEQITIGAEYYKLTSDYVNSANTSGWKSMIASLRTRYPGLLTYSAQHTNPSEENEIKFWDKLDSIGISAYFPLNSSNLAQSWQNWDSSYIAPINSQWQKPVLFTEIGYRSVDGAAADPWDSGRGGNYNPDEQVRDYQALLSYWDKKPYMIGTHWWDWNSDPNYGGPGNTDYTPQNKPVQSVLAQWYGQGSSANPSPATTQTPTPQPAAQTSSSSGSTAQSIDISALTVPQSPSLGQSVDGIVSVNPRGGSLSNVLIDIEVYAPNNNRIYQQYYDNQSISSDSVKDYNLRWTTNTNGQYIIKVGIFKSGWAGNILWHDQVLTINTASSSSQPASTPASPNNPSPTSPPTSQNASVNIWWPTSNATIGGVQPFKLNSNLDPSQYNSYWQVDGGNLNQMGDSSTDYPHKESLVDVNPWSWRQNGPYTLNFVIKDKSGNTLAQKSITISISR